MPLILSCDRPAPSTELARMWFVVGGVDEHSTIRRKPVAKGERRMIEITSGDPHLLDLEIALDQLVEVDLGAELLKLHREICRLHLAGEVSSRDCRTPRGA